jgi:preprotein translocase subunit SecA
VADAAGMFCPEGEPRENWDLDELYNGLDQYFPLSLYARRDALNDQGRYELQDFLTELIERAYVDKEKEIGEAVGDPDAMRELERRIALQVINSKWMEHLANMDYLREGIGLRGYAQQDPLVVYQKEAFQMFEEMQHSIQDEIARFMFHVQVVHQPPPRREYSSWTNLENGGGAVPDAATAAGAVPFGRPAGGPRRKPGRNDPCWCGSGKKYKHCHYPN